MTHSTPQSPSTASPTPPGGAGASGSHPRAAQVLAGRIRWEPAAPDGTRSATLVGDRRAGSSSYAFLVPAGVWDAPHAHTADAHLVVASGELRLGWGDTDDRGAATRFPAGSFVFVPAGAVHYDGADVDTVLIGTAVGTWSTRYA